MRISFSFISLAAAALNCFVHAYPNPGLVTGNVNPVADPTLCRDNAGTYWLFSTAVGIEIRTSTDRTAWTLIGVVWPNGASWTDAYTGTTNGNLWAPDCTYLNGQFYLYYAASKFGSQNVTAHLSSRIMTIIPGSWTNEGLVTSTVTGNTYNVIGDVWFLSLGSFWNGIMGEPLSSSTGKPTGTTVTSLAQRFVSGDQMEASVIWRNGNFYYLFTSWGLCCQGTSSTYNIRVGRSTEYNGGYVDANGVALTDGGGTLVLESHDHLVPEDKILWTDVDGTVIVYHYYTSSGTFLGINLVDFSTGWPVSISFKQ
ncbi:arabinanase [Gymnopus androsaceus JB14]|uniref:Endo-1,5-alpha-L-arabinanase A n=1 Tax=Gymnopus androsaceus JB14 TaxID=1447944 RepID=A0A6A4GPR5_9AGAR|nr:arabinanase [Gymnopus androsaceus JB14]